MMGLGRLPALKDALPTKSTEPTPAPSQAPISDPRGASAATPTPTLTSQARTHADARLESVAEPTSAPPTGGTCSLPKSSNPDAPCSMQSPSFLGQVDRAITLLTQQKPSIFDFNRKICDNCYYVKDESAFVSGVIKNLNAAGYCAYYDGEELAVKNSNSFNDQYDILISSGHIRRGAGSYRSTCNPSWF